jgi:hypothetical protein
MYRTSCRAVAGIFAALCFQNTHALHVDVIYGDDNRKDYFQIEEPSVRNAADATAALINIANLTENAETTAIKTTPFGSARGMCLSEPFYHQETAAFCSGFLVSADTMVTAGHCVRDASGCASTRFVFGFKVEGQDGLPRSVPTDHVFSCARVVHTVSLAAGEDFAVIKLDRPVPFVLPLAFRQEGKITSGTGLVVMGHPSGLPLKIAAGAAVREVKDQFFTANLDTYGGNSGSAVFNAGTGLVEGILVRGEQDYVTQGNCRVSKRCLDNGCRGEDVTLFERVLPYLNQ